MSVDAFLQSFVPDPHAEEVIRASVQWAEHLAQVTAAAAESAVEAFESAGPHPYETGDYVNSIRPYVGFENGEYVGRVIADDFKAWWLEVGTSDTEAFAALRRGADGIGLKVEAGSG